MDVLLVSAMSLEKRSHVSHPFFHSTRAGPMATIWQIYDTGLTSEKANTPFWILILMVRAAYPLDGPMACYCGAFFRQPRHWWSWLAEVTDNLE
jgi:hypothetical protein